MEAAIRTGYELITGQELCELEVTSVRGTEGLRTARIHVGTLTLNVGIVTGLQHVAPVLEEIRAGRCGLHFIEVMTCPVGCISGGGQPKLLLDEDRPAAYAARRASTFAHDAALPLRKSHGNPSIQRLYADFLGEPNSSKAHALLHTRYCIGEDA